MTDHILDVDLIAFERGSKDQRAAVVDGVRRSLGTGFVYTRHDIPEDVIDQAYGMLATFFQLPNENKARYVAPGTHGQAGYTGLMVETAATSDVPDWKEMLNWGAPIAPAHPLRTRYPHRYCDPVLPEADVPGITAVLMTLHERLLDLQRRFLRIIGVGLGCDEAFFDDMLVDGPTLDRAIRYPPMEHAPADWAAEHEDINLITALPRASAPGLQVHTADGWIDAVAPPGAAIINTGIMLARISNGVIPAGRHRVVGTPSAGERYSVVQFCHPAPWTILAPVVAGPPRYAPIEAGDLLDRVLWEINLLS